MGRLENIIARNRRGGRPRERVVTSLFFGLVVLLVLALMVFTDLGSPPNPAPPEGARIDAPPARGAAPRPRGPRVEGVLLRKQPVAAPARP